MNCEPGDLARVITPGPFQDKLFFVLHAAPFGVEFQLPDGYLHVPVEAGCWVIESAGSQFTANLECGTRVTRLGVWSDAELRPIGDRDGTDEMLRIAGLPKAAGAAPKVAEFVAGPTVEAGA